MAFAAAHTSARDLVYRQKRACYFDGARADMIARLPVAPDGIILEIGCGSGQTGALALARGCASRYVGIELSAPAAARAEGLLSEVVVGDVETMDLPWPEDTFDALILSEVLEHLVEPWQALAKALRLVKPGGVVLASSPNVAHWRVIRELVRGRFELAEEGVFDRTHMRWFTPATFRAMFEAAGADVVHVGPVTPFSGRVRLISRLMAGRADHLFMTQILLEARRQ